MKVYAGAAGGARHYLEAGRGRADDYYLTEGAGIARRFTAGPDGPVGELGPLTGEHYETWVAGVDPETALPRGRLRTDDRAVRFVEVVVNGPKSWSLAAALHPEIAAAYDAAQDRAASQIIGWLAQHATTRVGPAGGQVQVPVERLEAITVRHYTSRAGDPHRHLHLQINARVFAAGKWRGLHTIGIRDSLAAINGIGHAAVVTDPQFRAALAAHGFTVGNTGEILELAEYVGPFSARAAQIARNVASYERGWVAAHPGESPGPALRAAWDRRAWAENRPDKAIPRAEAIVNGRWLGELATLGYRDRDTPVALTATPVGHLDREQAAGIVLSRLGSARSAWNLADIRGEVEEVLAEEGVVADAAVRIELAEDVTARALASCLPLVSRDGAPAPVPEHIRALTARSVLDVEADLTTRLAARNALDHEGTPSVAAVTADARLDAGQASAVAVLAANRRLVVIEGAAGAGKTTTLTATRQALEEQGRRLVVVTPTLKAARVASAEVGAAGSAAAFAFAYGWRWDDDGAWTRLSVGQVDPATGRTYTGPAENARLRPGDLLVVDEAGMLDQDTGRALLTVADECHVRLALLGDRHQLAAVGRGGVLDLAADRVDPDAHLTLVGVHRFARTVRDAHGIARSSPDREYADLSLAMRTGDDPGAVFDALAARGQVRLHPDPAALRDAVAGIAVTSFVEGQRPAIVADTREAVADLNAAIRGALVGAGRVNDREVVVTRAGQRIGVGDRVATRRNDHDLDVANRDNWIVTAVGRDGGLRVTPAEGTPARAVRAPVTPTGTGVRVIPADYVVAHLELGYASTAYGAQGDTVPAAHLVVGESTGAASAYVGMTRGREANIAHLVADDLAEAREQWIAVFARDRSDLGPAHAARLAAAEAARYAPPRPPEHVLAELRAAWTTEQRCLQRLALIEPQRDTLRAVVGRDAPHAGELATLGTAHDDAIFTAIRAEQRAEASAAALVAEAEQRRAALFARWEGERAQASAAARVVRGVTGRLWLRHAAVTRASEQLTAWGDRWRPHVPSLPTDPAALAGVASWFDDRPALWQAFTASARRATERAHPEHAQLYVDAEAARAAHDRTRHDLRQARREREQRLDRFGPVAGARDLAGRIADLDRDIAATRRQLTDTRARIATLAAEPAFDAQPPGRLARERDTWRAQQAVEETARRQAARATSEQAMRSPRPEGLHNVTRRPTRGRGIGR